MDRKQANDANNNNMSTQQQQQASNVDLNLNQLDNLSNLIINNSNNHHHNQQQYYQQRYTSYLTAEDHDNALLDKYEYDMSKLIQEKYLVDKEQANQKLFQSFQTSACAVAQMFKDKTSPVAIATDSEATLASEPPAKTAQLTQWQSFQNSAGAITVLYKDSLEACKVHLDLGTALGQHRKLKELVTWLKKKKRRTIRREELINFLIGGGSDNVAGASGANVTGPGSMGANLNGGSQAWVMSNRLI